MSAVSSENDASSDQSWPPNTSHHVGNPRTHFRNPWPSFRDLKRTELFSARFLRQDRSFVPVPETRDELVQVQRPDWGAQGDPQGARLKATWIGHASWLVEFPRSATGGAHVAGRRGVRVLLDPVFADRTSPVGFLGPKRYSPLPCTLAEVPEVDLVCISHNHYDHLDIDAVKALHARNALTHFLCPLGNKGWFVDQGIAAACVVELDWWHGVDAHFNVNGGGAEDVVETVRVVCTPAQHASARTPFDAGKALWCSWALGLPPLTDTNLNEATGSDTASDGDHIRPIQTPASLPASEGDGAMIRRPSLYFAGDTGYRSVMSANPSPDEVAAAPRCPAFTTIGRLLGPFDIALVPVGLFLPRDLMSSVHCCPEDAVAVAKDVCALKSIGMHYGTFRGGISSQYEDVREPPRRWKEACQSGGLSWGDQAGLCSLGETVFAG